MDEYSFEKYECDAPELEKYLSDSIISYGIKQLEGESSKKLYCCVRNASRQLIGGVMGYKTRNMLFVSHLFIEPDYRRVGLGKKLLYEIEKIAGEVECDLIRLNTLNKKAQKLYLDAGFEETVCISNYLNGFDLIYYHKSIAR